MPNPSSANTRQINDEIGVAANTTQIQLSNNWVQNVAAVVENIVSTNTYDTGSGSVTAPSDASAAKIYVWGGGGGGYSFSPGRGGGGGGFALKYISVTGGSTSISYNVGAGGAVAGSGGTSNATVGGTVYNATGGAGATLSAAGAGGTGTNGDTNDIGSTGQVGTNPIAGGAAGGTAYGGGFGVAGATGQAPGAGGGTSSGGNVGQAGAAGRVKIEWLKENVTQFANLSWGICFPGRFVDGYSDLSYNNYANSANADIYDADYVLSPGVAAACSELSIFANGVYRMTGGANSYHRTWLTSGVNSDYTANFAISSGSVTAGSSATNTDLALSSDRAWYCYVAGAGLLEARGNLIIKSSGTELFRRPLVLSAYAETFTP